MWVSILAYKVSYRGTVLHYIMVGIQSLIPAVRRLREGHLAKD